MSRTTPYDIGVQDAQAGREFSLEKGTPVSDGVLYALGYLTVRNDVHAVNYVDSVYEDLTEYWDEVNEQRKAWMN